MNKLKNMILKWLGIGELITRYNNDLLYTFDERIKALEKDVLKLLMNVINKDDDNILKIDIETMVDEIAKVVYYDYTFKDKEVIKDIVLKHIDLTN
jgi:hypothetical protein